MRLRFPADLNSREALHTQAGEEPHYRDRERNPIPGKQDAAYRTILISIPLSML